MINHPKCILSRDLWYFYNTNKTAVGSVLPVPCINPGSGMNVGSGFWGLSRCICVYRWPGWAGWKHVDVLRKAQFPPMLSHSCAGPQGSQLSCVGWGWKHSPLQCASLYPMIFSTVLCPSLPLAPGCSRSIVQAKATTWLCHSGRKTGKIMDLPFNSCEILGEVLNARLWFHLCKGEEIFCSFREGLGRTSRASLAESAALDGGRMERGFKVPNSRDGTTWHAMWPGVQNVNMS